MQIFVKTLTGKTFTLDISWKEIGKNLNASVGVALDKTVGRSFSMLLFTCCGSSFDIMHVKGFLPPIICRRLLLLLLLLVFATPRDAAKGDHMQHHQNRIPNDKPPPQPCQPPAGYIRQQETDREANHVQANTGNGC